MRTIASNHLLANVVRSDNDDSGAMFVTAITPMSYGALCKKSGVQPMRHPLVWGHPDIFI
jgi:hypothetical protein